MKPSAARLAKHFGTLIKARGLVIHTLSPFEQRAFAGVISKGIPNMLRRIREEFFYVVPPFIMGYAVVNYMEARHIQLNRKDPKDYENDE